MARAEPEPIAPRTRGLAVIVAVAVIAAAGGFLASHWIRSPAEVAAASSAPPPSVITAPAEMRVVSSGMITRGNVGSLSTVNAVPAQPPAGVTEALITRLPNRAGSELAPGDVVLEVSGQPVFYLPGRIPAYRDLHPGDVGPDVTQLQRALRRTGYGDTDPVGAYGDATAAGVRTLYSSHGYHPTGGGLPMSAVDYVNAATSTVVAMDASLGQDASKATAEIAAGKLVVFVERQPAATDLIRLGADVELTAELLDRTARGTITKLVPATDGNAGQAIITPDKPLPSSWAGQDVRVAITASSSNGAVLAVPVSAISMGGDGNAKVVVYRHGRSDDVTVTIGTTGGGYAEIRPAHAGAVRPGDNVIVGTR
ncbi:MAG: peptidoglycan-binding protein [Marmoricola sp.]|nr:peptidoglycan-binding protein [Marmoricola sp.]